MSSPGAASRIARIAARTVAGVAMPVVSPSDTAAAPRSAYRRAMAATRSGGTSPSNGQPKAVAIPPSTAIPAPCSTRNAASISESERSTGRFRFLRLWVSDAETTRCTASTPAPAARSAPRRFGTSAVTTAPSGRSMPASTASASASCGTARGLTKDVTCMCRMPLAKSALATAILRAVGMKAASLWNPSRGPTSQMVMRAPSGTAAGSLAMLSPSPAA